MTPMRPLTEKQKKEIADEFDRIAKTMIFVAPMVAVFILFALMFHETKQKCGLCGNEFEKKNLHHFEAAEIKMMLCDDCDNTMHTFILKKIEENQNK